MKDKISILIVDDMEINRYILRTIFEEKYEVIEAVNGQEALDIVETHKNISVILTDLVMPVMDGMTLVKKLAADSKHSIIPVVVVTQQGDEEIELEALANGVEDFVTRPFHNIIIEKRVDNIIEKHVLTRKNMEKDLMSARAELDSLIGTMPSGIGMFEIHTPFRLHARYVNDTFCEMLGYDRDELHVIYEHTPLHVIAKEERNSLQRYIEQSASQGAEIKDTVRMIGKDGSIRYIGLTGTLFKVEDGVPIYHAVFTDNTDEKEAQKRMRETMRELKFRAERDWLTGVYNREAFYEKAKERMDSHPEETYVMMVWNIEEFKLVNDQFGIQIGDMVLASMTERLKKWVTPKGVIGRLEADHFAMCVPKSGLEKNRLDMQRFLEEGITSLDNSYSVMVQTGIYVVEDKDVTVNRMCDRAFLAVQTIKDNYLKRYAYYTENLRNTILDEKELMNDMETALAEHQFIIHLQPIYDANSKAPISAEALVRWIHPTRGFISPGMFIPLFERNGVITKLDVYIWEEVCKLLAEMRENHMKIVPVSVNISRKNFYRNDLCDIILGLIRKYNLEPWMLKLEITESAYNDNPEQLLGMMKKFQENGFKVLMDDFGSGYSSLNMLKDLPVDILKIDMKFLSNIESSERAGIIVGDVIHMAKSLRMETVAEGVETKDQFHILRKMGCDYIQGYYFSKPIATEEYKKIIQNEVV